MVAPKHSPQYTPPTTPLASPPPHTHSPHHSHTRLPPPHTHAHVPFFTPVPGRYMPILPMVLVNGAEGIGTGWSTFIPNYSPREIAANLRRLLEGQPLEPMQPWYRGFK